MNYDHVMQRSASFSEAADRLFEILKILRSPDGCPWDRAQTLESFHSNLLEESYEYIDALQQLDHNGCREELGDVMLVVTMIGQMHEEQDQVSFASMIDDTSDKLIRRHPHVFSTQQADHPDQVIELWDAIKEQVEGKTPTEEDFFHHIPKALPPLDRAKKIQKRAAKVGFDWDEISGTLDKLREEIDELQEALSSSIHRDIEEEIGDMLFSIVNIARHVQITPSTALHRTNEKFMRRFNTMRALLKQQDIELSDADLEVMESAWNQAKNEA